MESTREIMYTLRAMSRPGIKCACCTALEIMYRNVKHLGTTEKKHAGQRPQTEANTSGKEKRGNTVKFKSSTKKMNQNFQKTVSTVLSKKVNTKLNRDPENASSN